MAWSFVQSVQNGLANSNTLTVSFASPPIVGNIITVSIGALDGGAAAFTYSIADNATGGSNTYTSRAVTDTGGGTRREVFTAEVVRTNAVTFTVTVTKTGTATGSFLDAAIHEHSGLTNPVILVASATAFAASPATATTAVASGPGDLVFGFASDDSTGGAETLTTGYTVRVNNTPSGIFDIVTGDKVGAGTTEAATATEAGAPNVSAIVVVLQVKPAGPVTRSQRQPVPRRAPSQSIQVFVPPVVAVTPIVTRDIQKPTPLKVRDRSRVIRGVVGLAIGPKPTVTRGVQKPAPLKVRDRSRSIQVFIPPVPAVAPFVTRTIQKPKPTGFRPSHLVTVTIPNLGVQPFVLQGVRPKPPILQKPRVIIAVAGLPLGVQPTVSRSLQKPAPLKTRDRSHIILPFVPPVVAVTPVVTRALQKRVALPAKSRLFRTPDTGLPVGIQPNVVIAVQKKRPTRPKATQFFTPVANLGLLPLVITVVRSKPPLQRKPRVVIAVIGPVLGVAPLVLTTRQKARIPVLHSRPFIPPVPPVVAVAPVPLLNLQGVGQ